MKRTILYYASFVALLFLSSCGDGDETFYGVDTTMPKPEQSYSLKGTVGAYRLNLSAEKTSSVAESNPSWRVVTTAGKREGKTVHAEAYGRQDEPMWSEDSFYWEVQALHIGDGSNAWIRLFLTAPREGANSVENGILYRAAESFEGQNDFTIQLEQRNEPLRQFGPSKEHPVEVTLTKCAKTEKVNKRHRNGERVEQHIYGYQMAGHISGELFVYEDKNVSLSVDLDFSLYY